LFVEEGGFVYFFLGALLVEFFAFDFGGMGGGPCRQRSLSSPGLRGWTGAFLGGLERRTRPCSERGNDIPMRQYAIQ